MRLFVVAGEASGDLHGANLLRAITALQPACIFEGFGGERMAAAGMKVLRGLDHLAFMGFTEVVKNLPTVMRNFSIAKQAVTERRPDALLLIDYPGFNLRLAKWAKKQGIPVLYYIAPQVWAWKESRIKGMRQNIDRLMVILPFEQEYFAKHGMEVDFVGHPLLDTMGNGAEADALVPRPSSLVPSVALLPGSREQEVKKMLPAMLAVRAQFPEYRFVIGKAPGLDEGFYRKLMPGNDAEIFTEGTQALLKMADAALVTSGTATLETALLGVPQLVCYRGSTISVMLARKLIKVPYIALVNLILGREAVKELIQDDLNPENLSRQLRTLLASEHTSERIQSELFAVLGGAGASERAAQIVVRFVQSRN
ncbi:MAG: lipid-A-disaccharide synthase [Flavobacteriales bacterium]|nr:lipid-A-disaccharide synthase [Flavobacteriales bacterium]